MSAADQASTGPRILDPVRFYHSGPTAFFASQQDQRFSYCMYVPTAHKTTTTRLPLIVVVHGTNRTAERYRNEFREFAEEHECVVMAPLFPGHIIDPEDLNGFKRLKYHDIRFDHLLLSMVDEVHDRYRVETDRFYLQGFSGGGQFSHRFAYLHPERLAGVSIGAPGRVTRINPDVPWWLGTGDIAEHFGTGLDLPALRRVPVHMVVGEADVETWEIGEPGLDAGGDTRIARLTALRDNWERNGIPVDFELVPGVAHSGRAVLPAVQRWLAGALTG